jgi:hypothetical protein
MEYLRLLNSSQTSVAQRTSSASLPAAVETTPKQSQIIARKFMKLTAAGAITFLVMFLVRLNNANEWRCLGMLIFVSALWAFEVNNTSPSKNLGKAMSRSITA